MLSARSLCLALLLGVSASFAAETPAPSSSAPSLRGVLRMGADQRFSLTNAGGTQTGWAGIGESFEGWKLVSYKADEELLVLSKDGQELKVHMLAGSVGKADPVATKATLADAENVIRKMNFSQMMQRVIEQQKKMAINFSKQMAARLGQNVSPEELAEYQDKVMNLMFSPDSIEKMKEDFTRIYSEVFSKEELQGLADFYTTSAGLALVDKQPVVQQKFSEAVMPRMMAVMPEVQKLGQEFAAKIAAKAAAAKPAEAAAAGTEPAITVPAAATPAQPKP